MSILLELLGSVDTLHMHACRLQETIAAMNDGMQASYCTVVGVGVWQQVLPNVG